MEGWTMYSNLKAMLVQAGTSIYKGFEPFTTADTKCYIGLMMLHGLAPSPQMSYKFCSLEGSYSLVYRKTHPNWKIDPFLSWMGIVFRHAWHSGRYGTDTGYTYFFFVINQLQRIT
jgi:hypothetical protein